ncbi:MAG TPA: ABC transporter permease [Acidimicrobiales bacterium]|nr:ABC transporter permease [Acidimicrobiales bacterium]
MYGFLLRRLFQAVIVVVGVILIVFLLSQLIPGGECKAVLGPKATLTNCARFNRLNGFNAPVIVQFGHYLKGLIWPIWHPNLGYSYKFNEGVTQVIAQRLPKTLVLVGTATVLSLVIAVPLGIVQVVRRNRPSDYGLTGLSFVLYAMPPFLLGTLLIIWFGFDLRWFPVSPPTTASAWAVFTNPRAFVLPVVTLSAVTVASFSRYMRSSMMDALTEDYIRTARAKGASQRRVLYGHALRNALIPILTLIGLSLPAIVSGAVVTETVFNYPGMGQLTVYAAGNNDIPLVLGTTLVATVATVVGSLVADILYAVADPRIRFGTL